MASHWRCPMLIVDADSSWSRCLSVNDANVQRFHEWESYAYQVSVFVPVTLTDISRESNFLSSQTILIRTDHSGVSKVQDGPLSTAVLSWVVQHISEEHFMDQLKSLFSSISPYFNLDALKITKWKDGNNLDMLANEIHIHMQQWCHYSLVTYTNITTAYTQSWLNSFWYPA